MENKIKSESEINQEIEAIHREIDTIHKEIEKIHKEIHPALYEFNVKPPENYAGNEKELNTKILAITMKIQDQYPELSKYTDEMTITIPDEKDPEITKKNLKTYYESLMDVLNKYKAEHPSGKK